VTSKRNLLIAVNVVLFHVAALWALQSGLIRRAVETVVPVTLMSEIITPPAPRIEPTPAPPPPPPKPQPQPPQPQPQRKVEPPPVRRESARIEPRKALPPAPEPVAIARPDPAPAPNAPTGTAQPPPAAPPIAAPVAAAPAPVAAPAPPAPARVELPSSDADYLQNPRPAYPALSKRLGEQGKVMVRALIAADGTVSRAEVSQSSGFDRLDQAALAAVQKWRFVPGKRNGVAEAMWHQIPVNFVLE